MSGLLDLEELVLKCRDERARQYIAEAVACYQAAAYRACVVSAWIAITFDFLAKLRELELSGDENAKRHLEKFEEIRTGGEGRLADALKFERELLAVAATEFELLNPIEREDLARLQSDRNRCAHPSMQSQNEPYQPTAEVARLHMRNAVEILLSQEPVQGKAVLARLFAEVGSDYFPTETEKAVQHFNGGPLKRAKKSVIRNFIIGLMKALLTDLKPGSERVRLRAALKAVHVMHPHTSGEVFASETKKIATPTPDDKVWMIVSLTWELPVVWESLGAPLQEKVKLYLELESEKEDRLQAALAHAVVMPALRETTLARVRNISVEAFLSIIEYRADGAFCDRAISIFRESKIGQLAERYGKKAILPLIKLMSAGHIAAILAAVRDNSQINTAYGTQELLCELLMQTVGHHGNTAESWRDLMRKLVEVREREGLYVAHGYAELEAKLKSFSMWP
jgi:hypothetical protein